jgi:predicted exporter
VARVSQALQGVPDGPVVLDIKAEADRLYDTYVREAVGYSLAGFVGIVVLLAVALRDHRRVVRVVAPLVLAVLMVAAGLALAGRPLMILHIIGMLLIVAVGSNYALFFDRRGHGSGEGSLPLTLVSLVVANLATVLTFGVLAFSSVPVLSALGQTVAPGTLLALIFSAVLARRPDAGRADVRPA